MKYCQTCDWHKEVRDLNNFRLLLCNHSKNIYDTCRAEREWAGNCGPKGKHWSSKKFDIGRQKNDF